MKLTTTQRRRRAAKPRPQALAERHASPRFALPPELEARAPIEVSGASRDSVRLMIASNSGGIRHSVFHELDRYLSPGDVLVVNDSKTLPASLEGRVRGAALRVHLSTPHPETRNWIVEPRLPVGLASERFISVVTGTVEWVRRAIAERGSSLPVEVDIARLFEQPEYADDFIELILRLLSSPDEAACLPLSLEVLQFDE
jgi:S-adenosylmethionine:tRNA-ribosyltransferase-isomerase (queuine synthetase)